MKYVMIALVRFYQKFISPIKPNCCRFTPTCSAYAIEAFQKRGFFIGFILTFWRVLRCNPFCKGGYDPVPLKGLRNPKNIKDRESGDTDGNSVNNGDNINNDSNYGNVIDGTINNEENTDKQNN